MSEGATLGGFETWIVVQNPGNEAASVTLTHQTDTGQVAGPSLNLAPGSSESVNVGDTVHTYEVSTRVCASKPVIAERAVYYGE